PAVHPPAAVERERGEARAFAEIAADHIALVRRDAVLPRSRAQQGADTPLASVVGGFQARFQRRHLRQRQVVPALFAPGPGQAAAETPVLARAEFQARFGAMDV